MKDRDPYCVCDSPVSCRDTDGNLLGDECELFKAKKRHEQTYGPRFWTKSQEECDGIGAGNQTGRISK